jgi:Outer membrane cobalamin receptor protein
LKSVLYIEAFLILQIWTVVYPQHHDERIPVRPPGDTLSVRRAAPQQMRTSAVGGLSKSTDSTALAPKDTTAADSVRIRFIPGMGQITSDVDSLSVLHQKQFLWSDAKVVSDIIWKLPGFFYRDLGEAGKWGQLNAFGVDGRAIGILIDGRPMNDPVTGTYNLSDLPLEFIDHAEILSGTASTTTLSDVAGTALNFVSRSYNSYHPLTKLRFVQDPKGSLLTDGLFTQNVARGLNLMVGFSRQVSDGRYINANLDAWNVRTRLRYNISDRLNIALTDFYTKAGNGLNGGVNSSQSENIFTETGAEVNDQHVWDKRSRRDVTLNTIARIFSDSSFTTQANVYYSTLEREYYNPSVPLIDDFIRSSFWGASLRQQFCMDSVRCTLGGSWERRKSDSTRVLASHLESEQSLFLQAELRLIDIFVPSVSLRSTSLDGESSLNTGAGVKSAIADWLTLTADVSWFDRFPTFQERYWTDSTFLRTSEIQKEQHELIQGGFTFQAGSNLDISLTGFQRNVKRAIVFQPAVTVGGSPAINISNAREVVIQGINGSAVIRYHKFEVLGVLTLTRYKEVDTLKTLMPDVILAGEVSYRNTFFKDKLDAKFGVRSQFYNRQQGMQFVPQTLSYVQNYTSIIGRSTTLDLFMILKIGDAHILLSWQNVLNAPYILSPIYPMPGGHIRLGVNWVFLD